MNWKEWLAEAKRVIEEQEARPLYQWVRERGKPKPKQTWSFTLEGSRRNRK